MPSTRTAWWIWNTCPSPIGSPASLALRSTYSSIYPRSKKATTRCRRCSEAGEVGKIFELDEAFFFCGKKRVTRKMKKKEVWIWFKGFVVGRTKYYHNYCSYVLAYFCALDFSVFSTSLAPKKPGHFFFWFPFSVFFLFPELTWQIATTYTIVAKNGGEEKTLEPQLMASGCWLKAWISTSPQKNP